MRDFFSGVLVINPAFNEFQRADCAPFATRGDGRIDSTDVQQMRNYIAVLSSPQTAGGPLEPVPAPPILDAGSHEDKDEVDRVIRVVRSGAMAGDKVAVVIEMDSLGDETAASFTLNFDPAILANPTVALGFGVPEGTTLTTNFTAIGDGRLGILIDSGELFKAAASTIITVTFEVAADAATGLTPLTFDDSLINRGISNANADSLRVKYEPGEVVVLGRPGKGLD